MTVETIVYAQPGARARRTTFGYTTESHPRLDRVQNSISMICGLISGACILAITALTLVETVSRTVFSTPLGWSVSLIELYLLPGMAFFGIVTAYRSGAHVAVTSAFRLMPPRVKKLLIVLAYIVVLIGMTALGVAGFEATLFSFGTGESPVPGSSELEAPSWLWRAIVPTSMALGLVVVFIDLAREVCSSWAYPSTDYDPGDDADRALEEARILEADAGSDRVESPTAEDAR